MTALGNPPPPKDHRAALAQYRHRAPHYDRELAMFEPCRRAAIASLALKCGDVVLDVGCGTGLSLALLVEGVGARGRIIGIEQCPEMIERGRRCVLRQGWRNVTLIEASAEAAKIAGTADAALFHFTHDILCDPLALGNVTRSLRPGAHVVACGLQWASPWAWPLNLLVLSAALHSVSSLDGLDRPWRGLAGHIDNLRVDTMMAGAVYLASGEMPRPPGLRRDAPSAETAHEDS